ncbi:hypothetical protein PN435_20630, partial [Nodularia spumigena CS-590/02]|uniref:DUF6671 family protein n=1 Tax=Nodularia spumigena TaxID=70799 RepID=UPI00232DD5D9
MKQNSLFTNRIAVLATMHQKEQAIAPILEAELGIHVTVPKNFNTDSFSTFTRKIHRINTQIATARLKAEKALELTGEILAIASEGSFAPHHSTPFLASNREIVIILDKKHNLEIIGEEFSLETNHNHIVVESVEQAFEFADKIGFPEHGLVVMSSEYPPSSQQIIQGIITPEQLVESVNYVLENSPTGKAHLETDMRAMYNPTRMNNIAKATQDLVRKINSLCPKCSVPGFAITQKIPGLPCA